MSFEFENREEEDQPQVTPEEFLAERKRVMRNRSWWAVGIGAAIVVFHLLAFSLVFLLQEQLRAQAPGQFDEDISWKLLFRSIFFILGLFFLGGGIWGLREASRLKLEDFIPTPEAVAFAQEARDVRPYFTYALLACIVAVTIFQWATGWEESVVLAGLDKSRVWANGEYWRIMTSATLHIFFPLHVYFNGQALFGFGSLIEYLSNRAHLSIVFVLSIIGGGFFSLFFMPNVISVGASGGIMGLIGYLAVYGYRRKRQLPPGFLRSMLVNIGFIAAFGLVAYQIVDNFGHIGGFLIGVVYALAQVPRDPGKNPRKINALTEAFGYLALGLIVFTSIFTILMLLKYIVL